MSSIWFDKGWDNGGYEECNVIAVDGTVYSSANVIGNYHNGLNIESSFSVKNDLKGAKCFAYDSFPDHSDKPTKVVLYADNTITINQPGHNRTKTIKITDIFFENISILQGWLFLVAKGGRFYGMNPWLSYVELQFTGWENIRKVLRVSHPFIFLLTVEGNVIKIHKDNITKKDTDVCTTGDIIDAGTDGTSVWAINKKNELLFFDGNNKYAKTNVNVPGNGVVAIYVSTHYICTVGVIGLDGGVYFANVKYSSLSSKDVNWLKANLQKITTPGLDPASRIKTRNIEFSDSTSYVKANPWMDLTNTKSNPNFGKEMYSDNSIVSSKDSIIYKLSKKGITNYFPYKIVSLADLIACNRAAFIAAQRTDASFVPNKGFKFAAMLFYPDDPYLPLGDVCISDNYTDYTKTWVALIRNDSAYCIPNDDNDVLTQFHSGSRWDRPIGYDYLGNLYDSFINKYAWFVASPTTVATRDKFDKTTNGKDNISVGDIAITFNSTALPPGKAGTNVAPIGTSSYYMRKDGANTNAVVGLKNNAVRTYALPNGIYLAMSTNDISKTLLSTWNNGSYGIEQGNGIYSISYFNTFGAATRATASPLMRNFFDLLPNVYVAAVCTNADTLSNWGFTSNIPKSIIPPNCPTWMKKWMNVNNYENVTDPVSIEWCGGKDGMSTCDENLYAFCQIGPDGKPYPNPSQPWERKPPGGIPISTTPIQLKAMYPNSDIDICTSFMPPSFYVAKDNYQINKSGDAASIRIFKNVVEQGAYEFAECTASGRGKVRTGRFLNGGQCKPVTVCENVAQINAVGANLEGSKIEITQSNNCGGTGENNDAKAPPGAKIAQQPSKSSPSAQQPSKSSPSAQQPSKSSPSKSSPSKTTKKPEPAWYENCTIM
jgi:hypothetical protein